MLETFVISFQALGSRFRYQFCNQFPVLYTALISAQFLLERCAAESWMFVLLDGYTYI
jgi:hypothetical protein